MHKYDQQAVLSNPHHKHQWVSHVFSRISEDYDLMNDIESFGLHRAWKRDLVRAVTRHHPRKVLDVACGTGDIAIALARADSALHVTGYDFCAPMLDVARRRASEELGMRWVARIPSGSTGTLHFEPGLGVNFVEGDAHHMPFADASFDAVTVSFGLRNMADYEGALKEMYRVLRPGGHLYCLEASYPTHKVVKPLFTLYFKHMMPAMANAIVHHDDEYQWLNDSTENFLSKPQLAQLMRDCGFCDVHYRSHMLGAACLHVATRALDS
jgi:demethylmenaquinone methyltransferase/2-methoxy-6-polyprenyl-1,4-benzoquinol methylase